MKILVTDLLKEDTNYKKLQKLVYNFEKWKLSSNEFSEEMFGRDVPFIKPNLGQNFRHVHIVPIPPQDRTNWNKKFKNKSPKTSNNFFNLRQEKFKYLSFNFASY